MDPQHAKKRKTCRTLGIILLTIGGIFTALGVGGFIISIAISVPVPFLIIFAFLGMPLLFVGTILTAYGFMGAVARYSAGEMAPVATDTFNYMANETQDGVKTLTAAIGQGLSQGLAQSQPTTSSIRCPKCNYEDSPDAQFCSKCGFSLLKSKPCPSCNEINDPDAQFCDNCGQKFT